MDIIPIGSIINASAIIVGGLIGLFLNERFPERVKITLFQGLGLVLILIGIQEALKVEQILPIIFSLVIGGCIGELLNLEILLNKAGEGIKKRVRSTNPAFTEGFVAASLLFCIGALAVIGSINDGLLGNRSILYTKALLDGSIAIALASTYGVGVLFSALPILLYEGSITILSSYAQGFFTPHIINQLSAVGGLLIIGVGINVLDIKKLKVINLLPSLIIVVLFSLVLR